jgi:hypothetical protein
VQGAVNKLRKFVRTRPPVRPDRAFRSNLFFLSQEKKDFHFNPLRPTGYPRFAQSDSLK